MHKNNNGISFELAALLRINKTHTCCIVYEHDHTPITIKLSHSQIVKGDQPFFIVLESFVFIARNSTLASPILRPLVKPL